MNAQTARDLNAAACLVYMFREGLITRIPGDAIRKVTQATVAQIESAVERVEAENHDCATTPKKIQAYIASSAIPGVKDYAAVLLQRMKPSG